MEAIHLNYCLDIRIEGLEDTLEYPRVLAGEMVGW